jgi:type I restriction enzyme S subunit
LPPPEEQGRIAKILDTIDEAIRRTEQAIAKLQQMKQGLLHDLLTFGIGDGGELRFVDGKEQEFQDVEGAHYLDNGGWETVLDVAPLDRQCILTGPFGAELGQRDFVSSGVPLLRIGKRPSGLPRFE